MPLIPFNCESCGFENMINPAAMLGALNKGVPKTLSQAAKKRHVQRMKKWQAKRTKKQREQAARNAAIARWAK